MTVASFGALYGKIDLDDLQSERRYIPMLAYAQTKLANLLFALELGRREPWLRSLAAHPGATQSNLQKHAFRWNVKVMGQPTAAGALPSLRAATEDAPSGTYFAPQSCFHLRGSPIRITPPRRALDTETARRLWELSEQLAAVRYGIPSEKGSEAEAGARPAARKPGRNRLDCPIFSRP